MEFKSLDELVKSNVQKNSESNALVTLLTKAKINRYKYFTEEKFLSLKNRPFNFANYAKVIDKLDEANLYYEVETVEGFSLLEYNGLKFNSIELDGDNKQNSLKKYLAIEELNKETKKWLNDRYQKRCDIMKQTDLMEAKMLQSIINHKLNGKSRKPKVEEINEK